MTKKEKKKERPGRPYAFRLAKRAEHVAERLLNEHGEEQIADLLRELAVELNRKAGECISDDRAMAHHNATEWKRTRDMQKAFIAFSRAMRGPLALNIPIQSLRAILALAQTHADTTEQRLSIDLVESWLREETGEE